MVIRTTTKGILQGARTGRRSPVRSHGMIPVNEAEALIYHISPLKRPILSDKLSDQKMSVEGPLLLVGKPAPKFTAPAIYHGDFIDIDSTTYKGSYLCLLFYPADFSFVCPTELLAFSDKLETFKKIECEIVAVSCDSQYSHLAWFNTPKRQGGLGGDVKFPMLADHNAEIAKKYGTYCNKEGNAFRGLFLIDREQNLRHIAISDMQVGRSVEETLRLIQAFQFTDENGVVCPANWAPGQDTMHADPTKAKDYFEKKNGL